MRPAEAARAAFNRYASLDAPLLPSHAADNPDQLWLADLQVELARWQHSNFGIASDEQLALGVAEEAGELAHAVLKHSQRIRGLADQDTYREQAGDAIADAVIYAMQLATALRLDFAVLLHETARKVMDRKWREHPEHGGAAP